MLHGLVVDANDEIYREFSSYIAPCWSAWLVLEDKSILKVGCLMFSSSDFSLFTMFQPANPGKAILLLYIDEDIGSISPSLYLKIS